MPRFHFLSLGCPKNRVDTEYAVAALLEAGYAPADHPGDADVIIVNTCSFISDARAESIEALLELALYKQQNPRCRLVAMGCLVQEAATELTRHMPEIDLLVGTGSVDRLPALLGQGRTSTSLCVTEGSTFLPPSGTPRVLTQSLAFAYLKISDGCSRKCSFCTIPHIKGPFVSRPPHAVLQEARTLAAGGVKELVLVAQDATSYGRPGRRRLASLLDSLATVEDIEWIRLLYLYPDGLTESVVRRLGRPGNKLLPYVDLPIQHIDDGVLRVMRRGTTERKIKVTVHLG